MGGLESIKFLNIVDLVQFKEKIVVLNLGSLALFLVISPVLVNFFLPLVLLSS